MWSPVANTVALMHIMSPTTMCADIKPFFASYSGDIYGKKTMKQIFKIEFIAKLLPAQKIALIIKYLDTVNNV